MACGNAKPAPLASAATEGRGLYGLGLGVNARPVHRFAAKDRDRITLARGLNYVSLP